MFSGSHVGTTSINYSYLSRLISNTTTMAFTSYGGGVGKVEVQFIAQTGWVNPFDNKWSPSATYKVNVPENHTWRDVLTKLKEVVGPAIAPRVDNAWAVNGSGEKLTYDANKTLIELGISNTKKPTIRFPNTIALSK